MSPGIRARITLKVGMWDLDSTQISFFNLLFHQLHICIRTVDPEQHGFELHRSTYVWIFFFCKYLNCFKSAAGILQTWGLTVCTNLYHFIEGPQASAIGVSMRDGGLEPISHRYWRTTKFEAVKSYTQIFYRWGWGGWFSAPNPHVVYGQLN